MKKRHLLLSLTAVLALLIIACSAVIKSPGSPEEALVTAIKNGQNYTADGKTFNTDLDFDQLFADAEEMSVYVESELRFTNCRFNGKIRWAQQENRKLHFMKAIVFENCHFEEEVVINDAIFHGVFQAGKTTFARSLDLQRNSYFLMCRIDECFFGQDLLLQYSKCHEDLSLFGNNIGNHLLLQGISVHEKTQLSNLELNGSADLSNAHFHEDFMMDYAKGGKKVLGGNSRFYSRCFVRSLSGFELVDFSGSFFMGKRHISSTDDKITPNLEGSFILTETL